MAMHGQNPVMGISLTKPKLRILDLLANDPRHGYELAKELDVHGSTIYEHLHSLAEENYIEGEEDDRRIIYSLTEKGELIREAERMDG